MNELQIFKNDSFGEVRVVEVSGEPYFCAADVCNALGYVNSRDAIAKHVEKDDVAKRDTIDSMGRNQRVTFVNESGLYALIFGSKLPQAKQFKHWVTSEVLPAIRKYGSYSRPKTYKEAIQALLVEIEQKEALEAENKQLSEDNTYKSQVIEGLTDEIPLADMRQRIVQIMAKAGAGDFGAAYRLLYQEFDKKYHINVGLRMSNVKCKRKNYLDYIENELHMIPELYELTCKLFESDYQKLIDSWGKSIRRARGIRKYQ